MCTGLDAGYSGLRRWRPSPLERISGAFERHDDAIGREVEVLLEMNHG